MVEGDWGRDRCSTKWMAKVMDMRSKCDESTLETVHSARYWHRRQKPLNNISDYKSIELRCHALSSSLATLCNR